MPCNWSTTASSILRRFNINGPPRATPSSLLAARAGYCATRRRNFFPVRGLASAALAHEYAAPLPDTSASPICSATSHLTASQVSRAAAKTVRLCINEGGFGDALYVVNSACHSVLRGPLPPQPEGEGKHNQASQLEPIAFGQPVSPRLAAHAFLHGLIRGGYVRKASTYARLMMQVGIPIRPRTVESIAALARTPPSSLPKFGPFARPIKRCVKAGPTVLQLQSARVYSEEARAVLELLQSARTFGQRRTERMYRVLIETLLMQGEIIVASLLFVLLVKDWELSRAQDGGTQELKEDVISYDDIGVPRPSRAALLTAPYPTLPVMGKLIGAIDKRLSRVSDGEQCPSLYPDLQSLAFFAMLLDTGQIHTNRVAPIIRAMARCPRTDVRVWVWQDGKPVSVEAFKYFHAVLTRLISSLSEEGSPRHPELSRKAYNTLLSYALRHHLSPTMASSVLHHMCVTRNPPIPPDIVTYNILLRSGTLLRQMSISQVALDALQLSREQAGVTAAQLGEIVSDQEPSSLYASEQTTIVAQDIKLEAFVHPARTGRLARPLREKLELPVAVTSPSRKMKPNKHTLTSLVTHLVSTGQPEVVVSMLFDVLPELCIIDHPATNGLLTKPSTKRSRQAALKRAAEHGPYVYSAIINALAKAGDVGLAERVFILAQQAQQASRIPGFTPPSGPWTLPPHAYTSLMQCYAAVARGKLPKHKLSRHHTYGTMLERDAAWKPTAGHHRAGYAQFVHLTGATASRRSGSGYTRRQTSRRNAALLHYSMLSGGRALLAHLIAAPSATPTRTLPPLGPRRNEPPWYTPRPDARFFNAALRLFATPPLHPRRIVQRRHRLRASCGAEGREWPEGSTPMLRNVARAMVEHGYDVPQAYHRLLPGLRVCAKRRRRDVVRRPYAFPPAPKVKSEWAITTVKTRGLPVRKKVPVWSRAGTKRKCARVDRAHSGMRVDGSSVS